MSSRDHLFLLEDMLDAAKKIQKYTLGLTQESFIEDDKTIDAVIRNFEIIGEAANRIDDDFKIQHPYIEWRKLRGFRNRIVHDYFGIDYKVVWEIITNDLTYLIDSLESLLDS